MTFTQAMLLLGFLLSVMISSAKAAYTGSYGFFLGGLVVQMFFCSSTLMSALHYEDLPEKVVWARRFLCLYPPFLF